MQFLTCQRFFSKMEIVNEANFKSIIRSCGSWGTGRPSLIGTTDSVMVVTDKTLIYFWFEGSTHASSGDTVPSRSPYYPSDGFAHRPPELKLLGGIPRFARGPSVYGDQKGTRFDSLILLPFGDPTSKEYIRSTDVYKSSRLMIASILSTNRLLLITQSSPSERCPYSPQIFNIEHLLPLPSLKSPATVHISSDGTRVFVTDNDSDLVIEFRFDYSLVDQDRGCPDFCLVHWYLESGVAIGSNTRVSLINPDETTTLAETPTVQIIGTSNNGDSQGPVRLVNQRRWIPSSISPPCSISFSSNCVLVNTPNYLKLVHLDKGPDFPLTMRPPATNTTLSPSGTYFCLYAGIISAFRIDNSAVVPVTVSGLTECVDSFAIDPIIGRNAVIIIRGDPSVLHIYEVSVVQNNHVQFTFMSQHSLPSSVTCLAINQFGEWACLAEGGVVWSNCEPIQSALTTHEQRFTNIALCDDWFALVYSGDTNDLCLDFHALHEPSKTYAHFVLPSDTRTDQLRFESVLLKGRREKILYGIRGHIAVLRRDFLAGTTWALERLQDRHKNSICVLKESDTTDSCCEAVFVDTCSPFRVYESSIETLHTSSVSAIMHCFASCMDADEFRSEISWAILPETLRSNVEPLIALEKFPDTVRSTDGACRRYLIEFAFCREYPAMMQLSTEVLAWAAISETQSYLVQQITDHQTVTWENLSTSGIGFWCTELGLLKGLVESIQKNALGEYMKSKDPQILEDKVAIWLCILGKQQLLSTLYKQYGNSCASTVHVKIGQFLATDFSDPENANKAKKNGFELLRQKRYYLAVSMFILGGSLREALDLCCRQLDDVQLALFIAKVLKVVGNKYAHVDIMDSLIEYLWSDRIIPYSDPWMELLYTSSKLELEGSLHVLSRGSMESREVSESLSRRFSIPKFDLVHHSASKLISSVQDRMRRLNRPCHSAIPAVSPEEIASSYLARGLSGLARIVLRRSQGTNEYLDRAIELEISHQ
jgi:hypothetical protein